VSFLHRLSRSARPYAMFAAGVLLLTAATFLAPLGRGLTPFVLVCVPALVAGVVSALSGGRRAVRRLLGRMLVWKVAPAWYLVALAIPVLEKLTIDAVGLLGGAATPTTLATSLVPSALLVPVVVLIPALLEELGWRGFAVQAALDGGRSLAWAALVTSVLMLAVHVPLYLPGQLYEGLPLWPLPFLLISQSLLVTWVYLGTGSALLAGIMHAAFNATVPLTWGLDAVWVWQVRAIVLVLGCTALAVARRDFRRLIIPAPTVART
jgi:uncharacterized protein